MMDIQGLSLRADAIHQYEFVGPVYNEGVRLSACRHIGALGFASVLQRGL